MPSKDKAIQAAAARRHYEKNKVAMKAKAAAAAPLRRRALAEWVNGLKESQPCAECGNSYHPVAMDYHHRDPTTKENTVSRLIVVGASKKRIEAEIAKCDIVCAVCHRLLTHGIPTRGQALVG
jgi:hypothetical protein